MFVYEIQYSCRSKGFPDEHRIKATHKSCSIHAQVHPAHFSLFEDSLFLIRQHANLACAHYKMTYPMCSVAAAVPQFLCSHLDAASSGRKREPAHFSFPFPAPPVLWERRQKNTHTHATCSLKWMLCRFCFNRFFGDPADDCDYSCVFLLLNADGNGEEKSGRARTKRRLQRQL